MIKQLPGEYETVDMRCFRKKFSCPTTESFDELRGAVMAIIDHINNQQPKKPKSTNAALRERIAVLEQNNNSLRQKCEEYLGKLAAAKQALEKYADEDMWETGHRWEVDYIQALFLEHGYKIAKEALEQINRKQD